MRVNKLEVFKPVARVLGARRAKRELSKVTNDKCNFVNSEGLIRAFVWDASPQGWLFWHKVRQRSKHTRF